MGTPRKTMPPGILKLIDKRSECRDRACSGMTERAQSKQGFIPRSSAAEGAAGAGCRALPCGMIPFIDNNRVVRKLQFQNNFRFNSCFSLLP